MPSRATEHPSKGTQGKVFLPESINEANGENVDPDRKREWTAMGQISTLGTNCGLLYDFLFYWIKLV